MRPLAFYIISFIPCRIPWGTTGTIVCIVAQKVLPVKDMDSGLLTFAAIFFKMHQL